MSKTEKDKQFWERADEIIALANTQCDKTANAQVSTSLMFATARFNAFLAASTSKDLNQFKVEKEEAIKYFTQQYAKALTENMDEYIKNYESNLNQK